MTFREKKLGVLLSTRPETQNFRHGLRLAEAALNAQVTVYLYCIDDAVLGVSDPQLQALRTRGLHLYACAHGARRRNLPLDGQATYAGLTIVSDLMGGTDRFVSFN